MKIGEASRVSGVSTRSLHYYENESLIVPGRRGNGYRDHCQSTIDRVPVVRSLLESGLPSGSSRTSYPTSLLNLALTHMRCARNSCRRCTSNAIGSPHAPPPSAISRRRSTPTRARHAGRIEDRDLTLTPV
ncbi:MULTISPECIES: MerR family transcriptional regulator [unclassified Streptomyces]|uniref:MerR family transcriptional regulator n=1 Tax=unclassified Streptomyces TaxID=2593676 RepID=UPI001F118EC8|nr:MULTISPECIES: MerR family transcriptional regulator [unclassified Streptomyces]